MLNVYDIQKFTRNYEHLWGKTCLPFPYGTVRLLVATLLQKTEEPLKKNRLLKSLTKLGRHHSTLWFDRSDYVAVVVERSIGRQLPREPVPIMSFSHSTPLRVDCSIKSFTLLNT